MIYQGVPQGESLGELIAEGTHTAGEIARLLQERAEADPAQTFHSLNQLLQEGSLDERPVFFHRIETGQSSRAVSLVAETAA